MAFGNYYGGVTNEKNILDKLAEMTKELREVKVMLDMYVYYPEAGEMYDALWHLPENEADCTGGHVVTCIVPGVARKAADQVDDDVVLPAVVKVEMSKEE